MRLRFAFVVLGALAFGACSEDPDLKDTSGVDSDVSDVVGIDVTVDSAGDTGSDDTGADSTVADTGSDTGATDAGGDSASADSGVADTGTTDTGTAADTGAPETGSDTGSLDTGPFDTGSPDTGPFDTGAVGLDTSAVTDDADTVDAVVTDTSTADVALDTATASVSHTITIDGINDFTADEKFDTTSGSYTAYITWDASYVYVGYEGSDIGTSSTADKWVMVHLDGVTGAGSSRDETFNTQQHLFPTGFDSDAYFAWKTDGTFQQLKTWNGASWVTSATLVPSAKSGNFVEMAIPLSVLGTRDKLGVTTFMLNEGSGGEWTYAGLYIDSFIDGYSAAGTPTTVSHWVDAFGGTAAPDDASRKKP